jgi:hypothetical protein
MTYWESDCILPFADAKSPSHSSSADRFRKVGFSEVHFAHTGDCGFGRKVDLAGFKDDGLSAAHAALIDFKKTVVRGCAGVETHSSLRNDSSLRG